jgi:hypothetical protein
MSGVKLNRDNLGIFAASQRVFGMVSSIRWLSIKGFSITTPGAPVLAIARLQEEEIAHSRLLCRYVPPWLATGLSHAYSSLAHCAAYPDLSV